MRPHHGSQILVETQFVTIKRISLVQAVFVNIGMKTTYVVKL